MPHNGQITGSDRGGTDAIATVGMNRTTVPSSALELRPQSAGRCSEPSSSGERWRTARIATAPSSDPVRHSPNPDHGSREHRSGDNPAIRALHRNWLAEGVPDRAIVLHRPPLEQRHF